MLVDTTEQLSATGSNTALEIPSGKVALSIPTNRLKSISYAPRKGDHVSVIATMTFLDLDSEYQTALPNRVGAVTLSDTGEGEDEEGGGGSSITPEVTAGDGIQGRTELDPILNELFYIIPSESQRPRLVSQTVIYDAEVLKFGEYSITDLEGYEPQPTPVPVEGEPAPEAPEPPPPPNIITLIVSPQDAVTLNYLLYSGAELTMALRSAGDSAILTTEAATLQFLLDVYGIPIPAKLPYGMEPRIYELEPGNPQPQPAVPEE
jgi:pilus assembly protein CpaB